MVIADLSSVSAALQAELDANVSELLIHVGLVLGLLFGVFMISKLFVFVKRAVMSGDPKF